MTGRGGSGTMLAAVALLAPALSGCATLANTFEDEPKNKIYIGTRQDFTLWTFIHGGIFDWPFSLILDTILLPYTIPVTIAAYARDESAPPNDQPADQPEETVQP